jgi:hypothetical protein
VAGPRAGHPHRCYLKTMAPRGPSWPRTRSISRSVVGLAVALTGCTSGGAQPVDASTTDAPLGDAEGGSSSGMDSGNDTGTSDARGGGYASLCPVFSNQPTCPVASDAGGCNPSLGTNCAANTLPQGLSCSGTSQCQARIGPVDGCGRVDGWICSCIDGSWSCDDCALGTALCEGGAAAYELPPDSGGD